MSSLQVGTSDLLILHFPIPIPTLLPSSNLLALTRSACFLPFSSTNLVVGAEPVAAPRVHPRGGPQGVWVEPSRGASEERQRLPPRGRPRRHGAHLPEGNHETHQL